MKNLIINAMWACGEEVTACMDTKDLKEKIKGACTSLHCPERQGGECEATHVPNWDLKVKIIKLLLEKLREKLSQYGLG